jgi:hypothetical protein
MQRARGGRALTPRRAFTAAASRSFSRLLWCTKKFVGARARFPVTAFASAILLFAKTLVSSFGGGKSRLLMIIRLSETAWIL